LLLRKLLQTNQRKKGGVENLSSYNENATASARDARNKCVQEREKGCEIYRYESFNFIHNAMGKNGHFS